MFETAYAKLNLALHVRGREPDGYHRLETLFAFCADGDELSVAPGHELSLTVEGPFGADLETKDNLVLRAGEALRQAAGVSAGAALRLDKRLPVASGIGGGSADAAATLRLLRRLWKLDLSDDDLRAVAAPLGADVPSCVASTTVRGEGRGDRLSPSSVNLGGTSVLLVNPRVALSTPAVFRAWDGRDLGPLGDSALDGRNDLEAPAIKLVPVIADVLATLRLCPGLELARMSGSGATCFGLFANDEERDAANARIRAAHPDWWTLPSRLR
jgi:4-diphosphocytidyl-2-C-methyl-D-erythritol kinase